jgi:hypothetical protein
VSSSDKTDALLAARLIRAAPTPLPRDRRPRRLDGWRRSTTADVRLMSAGVAAAAP